MQERQSPTSSPSFPKVTLLHKKSIYDANLQHHLPNSAYLRKIRLQFQDPISLYPCTLSITSSDATFFSSEPPTKGNPFSLKCTILESQGFGLPESILSKYRCRAGQGIEGK